MATKKAAQLRIHQLAKELGVNSKDIVGKCEAEGIPGIENHLSPVGAGLAATIREWFGGMASQTAVETAAPVAVEPRRKVASRRASRTDATGTDATGSGVGGSDSDDDGSVAVADRVSGQSGQSGHAGLGSTQARVEREPAVAPTARTAPSTSSTRSAPAASTTGAPPSESSAPPAPPIARTPEARALPASTPTAAATDANQAPTAAPASTEREVGRHAGRSAGRQGEHSTRTPPDRAAPGGQPDAPGSDARSTQRGAAAGAGRAPGAPSAGPGAPRPFAPSSALRTTSARPGSSAMRTSSTVEASVGAAPVASGAPAGDAPPGASGSAGAITEERAAAARADGDRERSTDGAATTSDEAPRSTAESRPQLARPSTGPGASGASGAPGALGAALDDDDRTDPSAPAFKPVMNEPRRPDVVVPAGPQLGVPEKTALSGPRVIRVEAAESLPAPRPMRSGPGGRDARAGGGAGPAGADRAGVANRRTDRRRPDGGSAAGRSGRAFLANETPFEPWRAQDLAERDQRIRHAGGYIRSHRRDPGRPGGGRAGSGGRAEGPVRVTEPITVKELSEATGVKVADILKRLLLSGTMATINSAIDSDKAIEIMLGYDIELEIVQQQSMEEQIVERFEKREAVDVRPRPPVVAILGHVDHGKTSLLDRIRNTNVASGEAGGITQKTSAFQVPVKAGDGNRLITFIDTPGHEAFTGMRARGAKVTDIVVLVVAADDGVMPQTVESISHAKAAGVPIVVALNKIDRPEATEQNITRILGQLAEQGLNPTEWGGSTEIVRTSAVKGTGVQELLDVLDYQAALLDIQAGHGEGARGTVLESKMEEGRGAVANLIVQEGTLRKGNFIVIGRSFGRVRDIVNDRGQRVDEAAPSTPVAISGINGLPDSGDRFFVVDSLKAAEQAADDRRQAERQRELAAPKVTLDNIFEHLEKGQRKELALVVKADVHGSLETLRALLGKLSIDEVAVSIKHSAIGGITEADVMLAEASNAIVIGFNVTTSAKVRQLAEDRGIDVRLYEIIYDITDDLKKAVRGLLAPELKLEVLGHADVRQVFRISKVGAVAGCYVTDGVIERNAQIRVTRDGIVVEKDRRLEQLKRFKEDVREVRAGQECGMKISGYDDIHDGDVLECYKTITVARDQ